MEIDLVHQLIRYESANGQSEIPFELDEFRKHCLVEGLDDISLTEMKADKIKVYEDRRTKEWPWLDGIGYHGKIPIEGMATPAKLDW